MNSIKTAFLMTLLAGIMMLIGKAFGGNQGMMIMLVIAIGMNFLPIGSATPWSSRPIVVKK